MAEIPPQAETKPPQKPQRRERPARRVFAIIGGVVGLASTVLSIVQQVKDIGGIAVPPAILGLLGLVLLTIVVYAERQSALIQWMFSKVNKFATRLVQWNQLVVLSCAILAVALTIQLAFVTNKIDAASDVQGTQYVGSFPNNLNAINSLIKTTKRELYIAADYAAYGRYSNPPAFDEYQAALFALKCQNTKIHMKAYADILARKMLEKQLAREEWADVVETDRFKRYVSWGDNGTTSFTGKNGLIESIIKANAEFKNELRKRGVFLEEVTEPLPSFMWLSDGVRAIFSFYNLTDEPREMSFRTTNGNILESLSQIFRTYKVE
jgi:hypothetical protein